MSFLDPPRWMRRLDPGASAAHSVMNAGRPGPPPLPGVPNVNDAANAAQQQSDALRARRGFLSNIYGGASGQPPATGKTQLGI